MVVSNPIECVFVTFVDLYQIHTFENKRQHEIGLCQFVLDNKPICWCKEWASFGRKEEVEVVLYIIMGVCHWWHPNIKIKNMFKNHGINHGKIKRIFNWKFRKFKIEVETWFTTNIRGKKKFEALNFNVPFYSHLELVVSYMGKLWFLELNPLSFVDNFNIQKKTTLFETP